VCGDTRILGAESCDDGNALSGDGCSAECVVELGYTCIATYCRSVCGDDFLTSIELCDDGNLEAGDGCSPYCLAETGWTCNPVAGACLAM
jgi:cysteine-rich repeat protein